MYYSYIDFEQRYKDSELNQTLNMFEFGLLELTKIIKQRKRGLIGVQEYNSYRRGIERQLLFPEFEK
jgi:hypothetical protein